MIPSHLKHYLKKHKRVTLNDIALHFDKDPSAVSSMMNVWVVKGKVKICTIGNACKHCCSPSCDSHGMTVYQWVG